MYISKWKKSKNTKTNWNNNSKNNSENGKTCIHKFKIYAEIGK